jgi:xanthine dehydrogenase FAD-binding subunit
LFAIDSYRKAGNVKDAVKLLAADPEAKLIAGGTDVLIRLHEGGQEYKHLVDIHGLAALKQISLEADGTVHIGSLATFSEIMHSDVVSQRVPVIAEAAATVGGPQLRNMATIGGNICAAVPCADSAGALLVLEADLQIRGVDGVRLAPVAGFHLEPGRVALKQADVLEAFRIRPENYEGFGAAYYKYAMREAMDIATIGCAAAARLNGDQIAELRLAFTLAAPTPIRCESAEKAAVGKSVCDESLKAIQKAVEKDVKPRNSWRATQKFRLHVIRILTGRMVGLAVERAKGIH